MEIKLHETFPRLAILGHRVNPSVDTLAVQNDAQQVLVAIIKGTFAADDPSATPVEQQLPVFLLDVLFNLVNNFDFDTEVEEKDDDGNVITRLAAWTADDPGPTISQELEPPTAPHFMRVDGAGAVRQVVTFDRPLGGRTFILSFKARGGAATTMTGVRLESNPSGEVLLNATRNISANFSDFNFGPATWPAGLEDTEATLTLVGSSATNVDYDQVRLNEGDTLITLDERNPARYEHDLAPYKPRLDVVVLGQPSPPDPAPIGNRWEEIVTVNGTSMTGEFVGDTMTLLNGQPATTYWATSTPLTFGWESRVAESPNDQRKGYAGDAGAFDPSAMKLPPNFSNLFFNGGLYSRTNQRPILPLQDPLSQVIIQSRGGYLDGLGGTEVRTETHELHLPDTPPSARVTYRDGPSTDALTVSTQLDMVVDTVVYDKGTGTFYAVWRGVWDGYGAVPEDQLVSLELS